MLQPQVAAPLGAQPLPPLHLPLGLRPPVGRHADRQRLPGLQLQADPAPRQGRLPPFQVLPQAAQPLQVPPLRRGRGRQDLLGRLQRRPLAFHPLEAGEQLPVAVGGLRGQALRLQLLQAGLQPRQAGGPLVALVLRPRPPLVGGLQRGHLALGLAPLRLQRPPPLRVLEGPGMPRGEGLALGRRALRLLQPQGRLGVAVLPALGLPVGLLQVLPLVPAGEQLPHLPLPAVVAPPPPLRPVQLPVPVAVERVDPLLHHLPVAGGRDPVHRQEGPPQQVGQGVHRVPVPAQLLQGAAQPGLPSEQHGAQRALRRGQQVRQPGAHGILGGEPPPVGQLQLDGGGAPPAPAQPVRRAPLGEAQLHPDGVPPGSGEEGRQRGELALAEPRRGEQDVLERLEQGGLAGLVGPQDHVHAVPQLHGPAGQAGEGVDLQGPEYHSRASRISS